MFWWAQFLMGSVLFSNLNNNNNNTNNNSLIWSFRTVNNSTNNCSKKIKTINNNFSIRQNFRTFHLRCRTFWRYRTILALSAFFGDVDLFLAMSTFSGDVELSGNVAISSYVGLFGDVDLFWRCRTFWRCRPFLVMSTYSGDVELLWLCRYFRHSDLLRNLSMFLTPVVVVREELTFIKNISVNCCWTQKMFIQLLFLSSIGFSIFKSKFSKFSKPFLKIWGNTEENTNACKNNNLLWIDIFFIKKNYKKLESSSYKSCQTL